MLLWKIDVVFLYSRSSLGQHIELMVAKKGYNVYSQIVSARVIFNSQNQLKGNLTALQRALTPEGSC